MNYYTKLIKKDVELSEILASKELSSNEVDLLFDNPFFELVDTKNSIVKVKVPKTNYCDFTNSVPLTTLSTKQLLKSIRGFSLLYNAEKLEKVQKEKYQVDNSIATIDFLFNNQKNKIQAKDRIDIKIAINERMINNILTVLEKIGQKKSGEKYLTVLYYSYFDLEQEWKIEEIGEKMCYCTTTIKTLKKKAIDMYCESYNFLRELNNNDKHTENSAS
jgi:hypothetical protein